VKKIVDSLQDLPPIKNNLDEVAAHILGHKDDKRVPKLKKSIQYYLDGSKDNVIKSKTKIQEKTKNIKTFGPAIQGGTTDSKYIGSESLSSQVIFSQIFLLFYC